MSWEYVGIAVAVVSATFVAGCCIGYSYGLWGDIRYRVATASLSLMYVVVVGRWGFSIEGKSLGSGNFEVHLGAEAGLIEALALLMIPVVLFVIGKFYSRQPEGVEPRTIRSFFETFVADRLSEVFQGGSTERQMHLVRLLMNGQTPADARQISGCRPEDTPLVAGAVREAVQEARWFATKRAS